jgi:GH3 auxin-responsive promoter
VQPPLAPLGHRLFHLVGRARGALLLRGFEQAARRARQVNAEALRRILRANRACEIGRKFGFGALAREPGAYRRAVPLQRWADVAEAVDRMARGEASVLCAEPVIFFALSSGTTGASKRIPATASSFAWQRRYYTGLNPAVPASRLPFGHDPHPGIALLSTAGATQRTEGGIPVALASANGLSRVRRIAPYLWTSPWTAFEVADLDASWYLHALFGLRARSVKFLNAVFAPHLVAWLGLVEARWGSLLRDVAEGRIAADLALPAEQRSALQAALQPDPARAAELERAAAPGFAGFVRRAWPFIRYAAAVITGPFAAALPRLRRYLGDLPIHTTCWSASEGMLGLNLEIDLPERYVLCNGCAHFEFIPVGRAHEDQPPTLGMGEIARGEAYEIALSNDAGLYRYRLGDVVEVVDFHHESPVVAFRHRLGSVLDLVGEKTSEEQALAAVQQAVGREALVDYAAWPDALAAPPRYVFYVEAAGDRRGTAAMADRLEEALSAANPAYAGYRAGGHRLAAPSLRWLEPGAFQALERKRLADNPGVGRNQMKTPRLLTDEGLRRFLEGRVTPD